LADNGIISPVRENHLVILSAFFDLLRGSAGVENAFAAAELVGLTLEHTVTIDIPELTLDGKKYRLCQYPQYSQLTFSTPDVLERSLI
jgi:hypothetical protein